MKDGVRRQRRDGQTGSGRAAGDGPRQAGTGRIQRERGRRAQAMACAAGGHDAPAGGGVCAGRAQDDRLCRQRGRHADGRALHRPGGGRPRHPVRGGRVPGDGDQTQGVRGLHGAAARGAPGGAHENRRNGVLRMQPHRAHRHPRRRGARGHAGVCQVPGPAARAHRAGRAGARALVLFQVRPPDPGGYSRQRDRSGRRRVLRLRQAAHALRRGGLLRREVRAVQRPHVRLGELARG